MREVLIAANNLSDALRKSCQYCEGWGFVVATRWNRYGTKVCGCYAGRLMAPSLAAGTEVRLDDAGHVIEFGAVTRGDEEVRIP